MLKQPKGHISEAIRKYLDGLVWDGKERISYVAEEILHLRDARSEVAFDKWFVGAVARVYEPGVATDQCLVLVGAPECNKSAFFSTLAGPYYRTSAGRSIASADLTASWLHEVRGLDDLNMMGSKTLTGFVTSERDMIRMVGGKGSVGIPRSALIVGTAAEVPWFMNPAVVGLSRRWRVMSLGRLIDVPKLTTWRDQLWAEAVAAYRRER